MITDKMRDDYSDYLSTHISNVRKAFAWLYTNLPALLSAYDVEFLGDLISNHDKSKWDEEEYGPYCEYFYGDKKENWVKDEFDLAWLHHQHNNPHHWQHWLLREDDGEARPLPMPYEYVVEMVCDHWAFSWASGNLFEIFDWYDKNKSKMLLHPDTQGVYEDILSQIKDKLEAHSYGN